MSEETWTVEEINYSKGLDISFEVRDRKGAVIVQTIMREKGEGWRDAIIAEDRKNVNLIAAARDLFEACKWAEAALAPFSKDPAEQSGMALIRAALTKAEART